MPALQVDEADVAYLGLQRRVERTYDGRLPHSGLAAQQAGADRADRSQFVNALPRQRGALHNLVSGSAVYPAEGLDLLRGEFPVEVQFVECDHRTHAVHFAGYEQAVQKRELDFREKQGHYYKCPVKVGSNDM